MAGTPRERKYVYKTKNQTAYNNRSDNVTARREAYEIAELRRSLGMQQLVDIKKFCLRCKEEFTTFKLSGVFMCKKCRNCNESREINIAY